MNLLPVDYALAGTALLLMVLGLFRGFSGAFAFLAALAAGAGAVLCGWNGFLHELSPTTAVRGLGALLLYLIVFGLVRFVLKKLIGKLLAQPSDSIFGLVLGIFCSGLLLWGVTQIPALRDYSTLAQTLNAYLQPQPPQEAGDGVR